MGKRRDLEGPIHRAILNYLRRQYPRALVHHSPNENTMKGPDVARLISRNKSLGMVPGFPDIIMLHEGALFAFEVKTPRGRATPDQSAVGAIIEANHGVWAVVRSIDEVKAVIEATKDLGPVLGMGRTMVEGAVV
jgi:hypothetical protein